MGGLDAATACEGVSTAVCCVPRQSLESEPRCGTGPRIAKRLGHQNVFDGTASAGLATPRFGLHTGVDVFLRWYGRRVGPSGS